MQQTDLNLRHLNFKLFTGTKIMDFQGKQFIHSCFSMLKNIATGALNLDNKFSESQLLKC